MLYATYSFSVLLMFAMPIGLGAFLTRRFKLGWGLWGVGAATFILSQVVHLPLLWGLTAAFNANLLPAPPAEWSLAFNAVTLGLAAGVCEEIARYLVYRHWIKRARTWREAVMFGAGHGGVESVLVGVFAGLTVINMFALRPMDLNTLSLTPEQLADLQQKMAAFWSAPWYLTMLGAVERAFTLCFHISAAVLVLQAITRKNIGWLGLAILWHALADGVAVFVIGKIGPYWTEGFIGLTAVINLVILFALRPQQEVELPPEPVVTLPSTATAPAVDAETELRRKMDDSRFTG